MNVWFIYETEYWWIDETGKISRYPRNTDPVRYKSRFRSFVVISFEFSNMCNSFGIPMDERKLVISLGWLSREGKWYIHYIQWYKDWKSSDETELNWVWEWEGRVKKGIKRGILGDNVLLINYCLTNKKLSAKNELPSLNIWPVRFHRLPNIAGYCQWSRPS